MTTLSSAWKRGAQNYVLDCGDFYISYNPAVHTMGIFSGDGKEETALCKDGEYFILNGDFCEEYERATKDGYIACMEVYKKHAPDSVSSWSSDATDYSVADD